MYLPLLLNEATTACFRMFLIQPVFLVLVQIQNVAHELVRIYGIYFAALSMSTVLLIPRAVREKPQAGLKWVPY